MDKTSPFRYHNFQNNISPTRSVSHYIVDFQEITLDSLKQEEKIKIYRGDINDVLSKQLNKLESVRKFPNDFILNSFCLWFDILNYICDEKDDEPIKHLILNYGEIFLNDRKLNQIANELAFYNLNQQFNRDIIIKLIDIIIVKNNRASVTRYKEFYKNIQYTQNQKICNFFMKLCFIFRVINIKNCKIINQQLINSISESSEFYINYIKSLKNFVIDDEINVVLYNLICELGEFRLKIININVSDKKLEIKSFPTKFDKLLSNNKLIKLKMIFVNKNIYRAYKKVSVSHIKNSNQLLSNNPQKNSQNNMCKVCSKIIYNDMDQCQDCLKLDYCEINKDLIKKETEFFTNRCGHKYCKKCLLLTNLDFNDSEKFCFKNGCNNYIEINKLKEYLNIRNSIDKRFSSIDEIETMNEKINDVPKSPIKTNNLKSKTADPSSLNFIICSKCHSKANISLYEISPFVFNELIECKTCYSLFCLKCKKELKTKNGMCFCKCSLCQIIVIEKNNEFPSKCRDCYYICNICMVDYDNQINSINYCKICNCNLCRPCMNLFRNDEKYKNVYLQEKYNFCIFCYNKQIMN